MTFLADLHVHSHFSRATSGQCRPGPLAAVAERKGLAVLGTGDFTHAGWRDELAQELRPAEDGLYCLRREDAPGAGVRFIVTGEISCIYKQDGRTRKIHHLVLLPDLEAAARVSSSLEARGANLSSDGRPILGLDSRTLLAVIIETEPRAVLIPAHIWTPHFSLFGAYSGFDAIEECFGDLTRQITAYETGLSSDPPMNWRLSVLDRLTLISNSDAHSPERLGREANEFEAELSYDGITGALRRERGSVVGTIEFFPEEGKYHYDGHRNCGVCWHPEETKAAGGLCRVCGRPVTVGVLHRVVDLADRPEGERPATAGSYTTLVSLGQITADAMGVGPSSKRAAAATRAMLERLGPEIPLLRSGDLADIAAVGGPAVAEGVRRVRTGEIEYRPGFDGEYGRLTIFRPEERQRLAGQAALFAISGADLPAARRRGAGAATAGRSSAAADGVAPEWSREAPLNGLNGEQAEAAVCRSGPVIVAAGPGTGKTRTLIQRVAYLLREGEPPAEITAITFTHRAAGEMRRRLAAALGGQARGVWVGTFHGFCLDLLARAQGHPPLVLDQYEAAAVLAEAAPGLRGEGSDPAAEISLLKSREIRPGSPAVPAALAEPYRRYQERLAELEAFDYDDLLLAALDLLRENEEVLREARERANHLLVDEFQDVNAVQYHLVRILAGDGKNLFVIGDPNQAIYGFRGADHRYFSRLAADFPRHSARRLTVNYRSSAIIVRAAGSLLGEGSTAHRAGGQRLRRVGANDGRGEVKAVLKEIERLVGGTGMQAADQQSGCTAVRPFSLGEIAVLFRTGRQAAPLEEALFGAGIPYRVLGQRALLAAADLRQALNILRLVDRPTDLRFISALRESVFSPGAAALKMIRRRAEQDGISCHEATSELLRAGRFTIERHERLQGFLDCLAELRQAAGSATAGELLGLALPTGNEPSRALRQVMRAAGGLTLPEFLLRLATGQEGDRERREDLGRRTEGISLLTMHAAKGLEFPAVILTGLAEGIVPWKAAESEEDLAAEKRLFYVALTRAAEAVVLIGPSRDGREDRQPSRFLAEIPPELVEETAGRPRRRKAAQKGLFASLDGG